MTATAHGFVSCAACRLVLRPAHGERGRCPRCAGEVSRRKPNSISRTWALSIAAALLYIPSNLLPIMETTTIDGTRKDTIVSGIVSLWSSGSWEIAAIVFIASIVVPLLKLAALTLLLFAVQRRPEWPPEQLTRVYRLLELIGRWSMLDIYVVTILTAVVQFPFLARVSAGPAMLPFGAVVVLTMIAAMQFDPRLIWDSRSRRDDDD